jgi:hypothetical protein
MPRVAKWPGTASERKDRNTVVDLVYRVGRARLRFTVADLRQLVRKEPRYALHHSKDLSRHVAALPKTLIRGVGSRFGNSAAPVMRSKHCFVLTERWHEFLDGGGPVVLDDIERVRFALWVAVEACSAPEVHTEAVTSVLRNVEALALDKPTQTSLHLTALAGRAEPLARRVRVPGDRWVRWAPVGPAPDGREFEEWVATFRAVRTEESTMVGVGHATKSEMLRELVECAIHRVRSSTWPYGHSVTIKDIRAAVGSNGRAKELHAKLVASGSSLGAMLGDVSKQNVAGSKRVVQRIAKVPNPHTESVYYDIPGLDKFESRNLVVEVRGLAQRLSRNELHNLDLEHSEALVQLKRAEHPAVAAIAATRLLHVQHELEILAGLVDDVAARSPLLSAGERERWEEKEATFREYKWAKGSLSAALHTAEDRLSPFGLFAAEVLAADRPLLVPAEYASWFPPAKLNGRSPAEFLARVIALRRFPNPHYVSRQEADPRLAAVNAVDRADALVYAAEQARSVMAPFLRAGHNLIGRYFRDPALVRVLVGCGDPGLERDAAAALVLLGDASAESVARGMIENPCAPLRHISAAVYALLALKVLRRDGLPQWLLVHPDITVQQLLIRALRAARQDRWLLQP